MPHDQHTSSLQGTGDSGMSSIPPALIPGSVRPVSHYQPPTLTPAQTDEISRTVHVSNVHPTATPEALKALFDICGNITHFRLAGEIGHQARFAYVEFATEEGAQKAVTLDGRPFGDRSLKITHSKSVSGRDRGHSREEDRIIRKLKRAAERIEQRVADIEHEERSIEDRKRRKEEGDRRSSSRHRDDYESSSSSRSRRDGSYERSSRRREESYERGSHRGSKDRDSRDSSSSERRDRDSRRSSRRSDDYDRKYYSRSDDRDRKAYRRDY